MNKSTWLSRLSGILLEAIALSIVINLKTDLWYICPCWLIYSLILRFTWQSATLVHGFGHSIAIAVSDRELSAIELNNILEHQSIRAIIRSLLPFQPIFIPRVLTIGGEASSATILYLNPGKLNHIRFKALAGIVFNLLVAIVFIIYYPHNIFSQTAIVANLLIAVSSRSDIDAVVSGVADCLYCGNFGLIALRKPEDEPHQLLPKRMVEMSQQMGRETEVRGEQAGGGLVIGQHGTTSNIKDRTVFVGKKIVNKKRSNLTKSLEAAFAPIRSKAMASGVKPLESTVTGVWHYRYGTSGAAPSVLETHWHEWMPAREEAVWQFREGQWQRETKNVNHRITHNGDFDSWQIFGREVDNATLGLWLEGVLHTPNATKGDSPKIAGMMDLLITKGMWYASVRLAYQQAIAKAIEYAFGGQQPSNNTPNTAPSESELKSWAEMFDTIFTAELSDLSNFNSPEISPKFLKASVSLQQNLLQALGKSNLNVNWTEQQQATFIRFVLEAFFEGDLYRATQIFMSHAKGSFGLVTVSTLEPSHLVLSAKGQPITVGFNWEQGYMVYASESAAVDSILIGKPQSFRLDLDLNSGEIARVSARDITIYSLERQQELSIIELQERWISMADNPFIDYIQPNGNGKLDPVAEDIHSIPQIFNEIQTYWQCPATLNRQSADYLVYLLIEKIHRFEKKQQIMFKAGIISRVRKMSAVDLLITGEENSLWLGEKFARDLKLIFPLMNIVTLSANEVLQQIDRDFGELHLGKDSLVLAITQSGQTFSTVQVINTCDRLSSQGIIGEIFILTGEISSFLNSTQGQGGLTTITHSSFVDNNNHRNRDLYNGGYSHNGLSRIFVNGSGRRTAEPCTATVAAAGQTLTELLFYLARQMRSNFPHSRPFGMSLTEESLMILAMMKNDFINKNVLQIVGTTARGESIKSKVNKQLIQSGRQWGNHITETPLAWAIHALYILISVGWAIPFGYTIPLIKTLSGLLFSLIYLPPSIVRLIAPVVTLADIAVYIFGAWLWTLIIRAVQGRQLLARLGKRTLVIGDVPWVNQLLQSYVSKLFSLSYGIASLEVHSANPQNHLLHSFGHRVVRGTLLFLGMPDGRRNSKQQAAENAVMMTGKQASGVKNLNIGAEIIALGHNPAIARQGFGDALVLNSNDDSIYYRNLSDTDRQEIEELREFCFGEFERLLASHVFFWALAKKVASFPFLKYEYWKSQSRTKVMTTASPVPGLDLSGLERDRSQGSSARNHTSKN